MEPLTPTPSETPTTSGTSGRRETIIAGLVLTFCFLTAAGSWAFGLARKAPTAGSASGGSDLTSTLLSDRADLAIITVEGQIMHKASSGGFGSSGSGAAAERLVSAIQQAEKDGVKGILLQINSPGGSAAASDAVYQELLRVKKRSKIKVVAAMGDVAASGGYYIACAADTIMANPATLTGSIGVISQFTNFSELMNKLGVSATVIKSGAYKDIGSPFRASSDAEKKLMQAMIDDVYDQFLTAVADGRKMTKAQAKPLADGRIYSGRQAHQLKLIDQLGDYTQALDLLRKTTQLGKDAKVKDYMKPSFNDILASFSTRVRGLGFSGSLEELAYAELMATHKLPLMLYQ